MNSRKKCRSHSSGEAITNVVTHLTRLVITKMVNHHNGETSPQRWRSHQNGEIGPLRERIGWPQGPHPPKFACNTAKARSSSNAKPRNSPKYPRRALGSCSLGVWTPVCRVTNSVKWVQKVCYGENSARRVPKTVEMWCVDVFCGKRRRKRDGSSGREAASPGAIASVSKQQGGSPCQGRTWVL